MSLSKPLLLLTDLTLFSVNMNDPHSLSFFFFSRHVQYCHPETIFGPNTTLMAIDGKIATFAHCAKDAHSHEVRGEGGRSDQIGRMFDFIKLAPYDVKWAPIWSP